MSGRARWLSAVIVAVVAAAVAGQYGFGTARPADTLPASLSDQEFWALSRSLSEPDGYFRSENLVSNEHTYQYVLPALERAAGPGGVYLGVAPDQNFTYMAAVRPQMAFIVDIRRGNLLQHLMYKALFELSDDRAAFVSRLFSKPVPEGLPGEASVPELLAGFARVPGDEEIYRRNLSEILGHLTVIRGFDFTGSDTEQLAGIYRSFFRDGPGIRYSMSSRGFGGRGGRGFPSWEELMMQTDPAGLNRSYLADEESYGFIRGLQQRNLVVPVVGDFAGPRALRSVGEYARGHGATVSAFYVSNVEQYLFQDGLWDAFAANVAALPVDGRSTLIRSVSTRFGYRGQHVWHDGRASALDPIVDLVEDFQRGQVRTYEDVNMRSR